jgi:hypothetical protein
VYVEPGAIVIDKERIAQLVEERTAIRLRRDATFNLSRSSCDAA